MTPSKSRNTNPSIIALYPIFYTVMSWFCRPQAILFIVVAFVLSACTGTIRGSELALEYYNLGNAYYDLGSYDKAMLYYQKAINLDQTNRKALYNLSLSLIASGRAGEALKVLEGLLEQDPKNQSVQEALAFAYVRQQENDRAIETYRAILAVSPENNKARFNLAVLLRKQEDREAALEAFTALLDNDPADLEALIQQGELLLELNRPGQAVEVMLRYLQSRPDNAGAYLLLAEGYRILERYDKALAAYAEALAYDDSLAEAWFYSALIQLTKIEDPDRGLTALSAALEAGFDDREKIRELLELPTLLEREKVTLLLEKKKLVPAALESSP